MFTSVALIGKSPTQNQVSMVKFLLELQSPEEVAAALTSVQEVASACLRIDDLTGNVQKCVQIIKKAGKRLQGLEGLLRDYRQYSAIVYSSTLQVECFEDFQALPL